MPLFELPRQFHVASNGTPYAQARLYTYRATTTTPLDVYTTNAYSVAHTNPVEADANGIFPAIYINPDSGYDLKIELRTSADVLIYTEDNIPRQDSDFSNGDFSGNVTIAGTLSAGATTVSGAQVTSTEPRVKLYESDAATDKKFWDIHVSGETLSIRTRTDADAAGKDILVVTRGTTTAIGSIAIGNATDTPTVTLNGTALVAANIAQQSSGSFSITLTGFGSNPSGTMYWQKVGNLASLFLTGTTIFATSNATSMACSGVVLPEAIRPATNKEGPCTVLDNGIVQPGTAYATSAGQLIFNCYGAGGVLAAGFTNSGDKGLPNFWTFTYPLT